MTRRGEQEPQGGLPTRKAEKLGLIPRLTSNSGNVLRPAEPDRHERLRGLADGTSQLGHRRSAQCSSRSHRNRPRTVGTGAGLRQRPIWPPLRLSGIWAVFPLFRSAGIRCPLGGKEGRSCSPD